MLSSLMDGSNPVCTCSMTIEHWQTIHILQDIDSPILSPLGEKPPRQPDLQALTMSPQ